MTQEVPVVGCDIVLYSMIRSINPIQHLNLSIWLSIHLSILLILRFSPSLVTSLYLSLCVSILRLPFLFSPFNFRFNPWLIYGEPLHRLREFGITAKELDLVDEARLSTEQMRRTCSIMFVSPLYSRSTSKILRNLLIRW